MNALTRLFRLSLFLALTAASSTQLFGIEVMTQQILVDVKIAEVSTNISKEMIGQLPSLSRSPGCDFLKFVGPGSIDTTKMIGHTNPLRTINTTPGATSSIVTNGIQFNFVPTIQGNGTSIRMEISPEQLRDVNVPARCRANFNVPFDSSLFIGFHGPKTPPGRDLILIFTPSLGTSPSTTYAAAQTTTTSTFSRFEFGAYYNYMQVDEEDIKGLHGFNITGYYNFNPHVAVGVQFGGYYASDTNRFGEEMFLDRYSFMAGPRLQCGDSPVRPFGQVLFGAVHDRVGVEIGGDYYSTSATAFGMSIGGGVNFEVTQHFTITPSIDWFPTFFDGRTSRQDNWRIGFGAAWRF